MLSQPVHLELSFINFCSFYMFAADLCLFLQIELATGKIRLKTNSKTFLKFLLSKYLLNRATVSNTTILVIIFWNLTIFRYRSDSPQLK